jgi:hypothetical protein
VLPTYIQPAMILSYGGSAMKFQMVEHVRWIQQNLEKTSKHEHTIKYYQITKLQMEEWNHMNLKHGFRSRWRRLRESEFKVTQVPHVHIGCSKELALEKRLNRPFLQAWLGGALRPVWTTTRRPFRQPIRPTTFGTCQPAKHACWVPG